MKYIKQFGIIIIITLAAELLERCIPFPVPAGIYGLVLLFLLLISGKLKLEAVEESGNFLVEIMPLMFIPAGVGLMESYHELDGIMLPVILVVTITTVIVMAVTGYTAQWMLIRKEEQNAVKKEKEEGK